MGTFVDLLLLVIVALFMLIGIKNGFVRTLLSLVSRIASVVLAYLASDKYAEMFYEKFLKERIVSSFDEHVATTSLSDVSQQVSAVLDSIPESVSGILNVLGIDLASFSNVASDSIENSNVSSFLEETIAGPASVFVCRIIIFVIVSLLASLAFSILIKLLCKIVDLPVLKTANKALGGILGLLNGIILSFIASYVCVIISGWINYPDFNEAVNASYLIEFFTSTMNGFIGV